MVSNLIGCGKQYTNSRAFKAHRSTRNKKLVCNYSGCHVRTALPHQMKLDVNAVDKKYKLFKCSNCDKWFATESLRVY